MPSLRRVQIACSMASSTNGVVIVVDVLQPRIRREYASMTNATYTQPDHVERAILNALGIHGLTQRRISEIVGGASHTTIHRLVHRLLENPDQVQRITPAEVIDRRTAGMITDDEMMDQLMNWSYSFGYIPKMDGIATDAYISGDWDDVEHAFYRDLLSDDEFTHLMERQKKSPQASISHQVTAHSSLRDEVVAQLAALSAPGQPLNTAAETSTWIRYAGDPLRASMRKTIIRRYLDRESPQCEGRSAILTVGPPGAGKTNMLRSQVPDLASYRILDADIVKDYLIEAAVGDGIYDDLLAHELPDRHTIAPRELAALVHDESTNLINEIRKHCVEQRENIVVEGTLKWPDQGPDVFSQLADAYYSSVEVLGIEVDPDTAHRQALSRWWSGRTRWVAGTDTLGGRFTPPDAIDGCYPCAASNASMTSALMRPRGETSKPFLPAHSRIACSCSADRARPLLSSPNRTASHMQATGRAQRNQGPTHVGSSSGFTHRARLLFRPRSHLTDSRPRKIRYWPFVDK